MTKWPSGSHGFALESLTDTAPSRPRVLDHPHIRCRQRRSQPLEFEEICNVLNTEASDGVPPLLQWCTLFRIVESDRFCLLTVRAKIMARAQ